MVLRAYLSGCSLGLSDIKLESSPNAARQRPTTKGRTLNHKDLMSLQDVQAILELCGPFAESSAESKATA